MNASSPFEELAQTYDADFTASRIGQIQRQRVWQYLLPLVSETGRPLNILEINCGTGEDAIRLASLGHHVVATDASPAMIAKAKEKINSTSAYDIQFSICSFDQLTDRFGGLKFDLVLSNFGGLNCINKAAIIQLRDSLSSLLNEDGKLFFVVMGRCCLWEMMHYGSRAKFTTAFRRFRHSVNFTINGQSIPVYYYSPKALKKMLSSSFRLIDQRPVGLFIPPSYLESRFAGDDRKLKKLCRKEEQFSSPFFARFADHYCATFKKTESLA